MDLTFKLIAVGIYFLAMLAIGLYAYRKTDDGEDYMLGGRNLHPFTAALSAGASDMSGWLMMGLPGALYLSGLVEVWIAIGLTVGAAVNWIFVAPRLRQHTQIAGNSITLPSFFENRLRDRTRLLRIAAGLVILVFFAFYVSSGMVAGGLFFESTFGGSYVVGMLLVAGVTIVYTLFGGFLGASYTDVVQGLIMMVSLIAVPIVAMVVTGGPAQMFHSAFVENPEFGSLVAGASIIAIVGNVAWGLGYFGQPHIIVRFMALRTPGEAKTARRIGIGWMFLTTLGAILTAFIGVAYFAEKPLDKSSSETVFLLLSQTFFHPLIAGLVLAAVLAAIMSTMSSQLIVCSSALVEDLYNITGRKASPKALVNLGRSGVLLVAIIAAVLALNPNSSILELVSFAWAGFGAAFGPIVLLSLYWRKLTAVGGFAGMVSGAVVVFIWGNIKPLSSAMYEIVPGFIVALLVAWLVSRATFRPNPTIDAEFTEMEKEVGSKVTA